MPNHYIFSEDKNDVNLLIEQKHYLEELNKNQRLFQLLILTLHDEVVLVCLIASLIFLSVHP